MEYNLQMLSRARATRRPFCHFLMMLHIRQMERNRARRLLHPRYVSSGFWGAVTTHFGGDFSFSMFIFVVICLVSYLDFLFD
jgi:hypothetical protein